MFQVPSTSQTPCTISQTCCCFHQKIISTHHSVYKKETKILITVMHLQIKVNYANESRNVKLIYIILIPLYKICVCLFNGGVYELLYNCSTDYAINYKFEMHKKKNNNNKLQD